MEFREFTQVDWYGYAGCEKPTNGIEEFEPMIAYVHDSTMIGCGWTIVVDAVGIAAELLSEDGEPLAFLAYDKAWPENLRTAKMLAKHCQMLDYGTLRVLGFKPDE